MNTQEQIRNYIDILNEDPIHRVYRTYMNTLMEAPTKTDTETKVKPNLDDLFKNDQHDIATTKQGSLASDEKIGRPRRSARPVNIKTPLATPTHNIGDVPTSDLDDDWGDLDEPMPTPQLTTQQTVGHEEPPKIASNLPTVQNNELANIPKDLIQRVNNIEWNNIMALPGNMKQMIRNMGRQVFAGFGEMDYEEIDTIATATHDKSDLDAVANMVKQYGSPVIEEAEMDFGDVIPGYKPIISIWELAGQYYKFVKDDYVEAIYTWEHKETNKLPKWEQNKEKSNAPETQALDHDQPSIQSDTTIDSDDLDDLINSLY